MTSSGGIHILIVDDDRMQREILSKAFCAAGYQTDVAAEGLAALALTSATQYAVACLDYQMPGMNGIELFNELRIRQPWIRAILITGYGPIRAIYPTLALGMKSVLPKPIDLPELLKLMALLVAEGGSANGGSANWGSANGGSAGVTDCRPNVNINPSKN